jgi:hypothetical protein
VVPVEMVALVEWSQPCRLSTVPGETDGVYTAGRGGRVVVVVVVVVVSAHAGPKAAAAATARLRATRARPGARRRAETLHGGCGVARSCVRAGPSRSRAGAIA